MATNSTPEAASRIAELNDAVNELQGHLSAHKGISDGKSVIIAELEAEIARLRRNDRIGSHSPDCWSLGPRHYDCAARRVAELEAEIARRDAVAAAPVPPAGSDDCCPLCSGDCAGANPPVLDCPLAARAQPPVGEGWTGNKCPSCAGTGERNTDPVGPCSDCGGTGDEWGSLAHPTEPAAWDGGGAITEDMVYRGADVLNASKLTECFGDAGPWMGLSRAVLDAALAAGGEK